MCSRETSAGSAAQTASVASSNSFRAAAVRVLRRSQAANVCASQRSAFGAVQGASSGTRRAIRSSRARACSKSASASGEIARERSRTSCTPTSATPPE